MPQVVCWWPGFVRLWEDGSWVCLSLAGGFTLLLNGLIVSTWVWTAWLDTNVRIAGWVVLLVGCLASLLWGIRGRVVDQGGDRADDNGRQKGTDFLGRAQLHYLQGNWFEAKSVLEDLIRQDDRDIEARLMLATLCRHRKWWQDAAGLLDKLERFDGATKWQQEILRERAQLTARQKQEVG